jgi:hypothetical protein
LRRTAARSRIVDVTRLFKLALAAVFLLTFAAPPAGAQGDDGRWGWYFFGIIALGVAAFFGGTALIAIGLDRAVPDPAVALAEEHVKINLTPGGVRVSTECVFQNDAEEQKTVKLTYPFGKGRGVGAAENVAVTDGAGAKTPFTQKRGSIKFGLAVPAQSRAEVIIDYDQPASGTTFIYLLGKDRRWGRGGAYTTFLVTAPAAFGEVTSVYPLDKVAERDGYVSYVYTNDEFYPQTNFAITW